MKDFFLTMLHNPDGPVISLIIAAFTLILLVMTGSCTRLDARKAELHSKYMTECIKQHSPNECATGWKLSNGLQ